MSFPDKTPDEEKLLTFDFSTEAAEGNTLSNATVEAVLVSGSGDESDLTLGTPVIAGQTVQVMASDGLDGAKYQIICEVDASNTEHHRIDKILPVKEKAALVS